MTPMTPITALDIEDLAQAIATAINEAVSPLEQRLATLEARPLASAGCKWAGIWRAGTKFAEAEITTHAGSLWILTNATPNGEPPGRDPAWRLILKKGSHRGDE